MLRRRASISFRPIIWFGAIFLAGWVLFGAAMWINLKLTLVNERYLTLRHRIDRLQRMLNGTQNENATQRVADYQDLLAPPAAAAHPGGVGRRERGVHAALIVGSSGITDVEVADAELIDAHIVEA